MVQRLRGDLTSGRQRSLKQVGPEVNSILRAGLARSNFRVAVNSSGRQFWLPPPHRSQRESGSAHGENLHTTCYNLRMRPHDYAPRPAHLKWLLDSDPAIRWQVMRDLTDEAPNAIAAEQSRVATEGWGAQLLARQSPVGNWGGSPRGSRDDMRQEDRGLLITLYALTVLMDLGLDPASKQARKMVDRVDKRLVFRPLNNRPFLHGETEPCINGRILAIGAYFKEPNDALANQLLGQQLEDGGWNCEAPKSRRSSFHTTICVLEGLLEYERAQHKSVAVMKSVTKSVTQARKRAENYLLERRMFRSLRTGEVIDKSWLRFSFPPFWHYDVLRGTRLSAKCRNQTRQPRQRGDRNRA